MKTAIVNAIRSRLSASICRGRTAVSQAHASRRRPVRVATRPRFRAILWLMRNALWVLALAAFIMARAALPCAQTANLQVPNGTRLLVVAPHPDDESLAAAGLIHRVASTGGTVMVLALTSGDAFAEGVEKEDRITRPTAGDYRGYGTLRERESAVAMKLLGVPRQRVAFLGFPDEGLCMLASTYLSAKSQAFESQYTDRVSPPLTERVIRGTRYRGSDVVAELERVLTTFAPTMVVGPHPADAHPDHCSTHIFLREALSAWSRQTGRQPRVLHYIIHYRSWPLSEDAGVGSELHPPADFPPTEGHWLTLKLTPEEVTLKKRALLAYSSQMLVIGRFLTSFARGNELFLEGEPAHLPECWCDGNNVATELRPDQYQRRPASR